MDHRDKNEPGKGIYAKGGKRCFDALLSFGALVGLSPLLLAGTAAGWLFLGGNPFFVQERPGKDGKPFSLVKFRTMTMERDADGNLLPDEKRLTAYGKFLRKTSLDELPELWNILKGEMSFVGPRPLLVEYLPLYTEEQNHRHDVRPGLTGLAQVRGRNLLSWEERFLLDVAYTKEISFREDLLILWQTVLCVLRQEGISSQHAATMEPFEGSKKQGRNNRP